MYNNRPELPKEAYFLGENYTFLFSLIVVARLKYIYHFVYIAYITSFGFVMIYQLVYKFIKNDKFILYLFFYTFKF